MLLELTELFFAVMLIIACSSLLYAFLEITLPGARKWLRLKTGERKGRVRKLRPWVTIDLEHTTKAKEDGELRQLSVTSHAEPETLDSASQVFDKPAKHKLDRYAMRRLDQASERERLDRSPSRTELDVLKRILQLPRGSMCFKHGSVYLVESMQGKHVWTRLGSWEELKAKIPSTE
jgi:hypothetical protein